MGRLILKRNLRHGAKDWLFGSASRLCFIEGEEGDAALTPDVGGAAEPAPSLHDAMSAAWDAAETAQTAQPGVQQPVGAPPAQQAAAPASEAAKTPAQLAAEQAARDAAGRFAKPGEAVQLKPVAPNAPGAPGEPGAAQAAQIIAPPPSWSAPAKAKFAALDPIIQQEVLKRERDIETGKAEWEGKAQKFNAIDEILAPRRSQLAVAGLDDVGAVRALFAAQDMLQTTPVDALLYLGRTVNVNWNMLVQRLTGHHVAPQQPGQPQGQPMQQPQPATDPRLVQHIQHLTNTVNQQQQERQQATRSQVDQEINVFAADPANLYFANVKGAMAQIISGEARAGNQITLKDAYERAIWADPTIRPLLITAQGTDQQRAAATAAQAAAARARQASGSLAGSPTPGARQATPKRSITDELSANWDAAVS